MLKLADYKGKKKAILYFYPKVDRPGCTIQANQYTELVEEFSKYQTVAIGVSMDSCDSHSAFRDKYGLRIDLLADTNGVIYKNYGVWQEEKNGYKKVGVVRLTILINEKGDLQDVMYGVSPDGHVKEMLNKVKEL